MPLNRRDLLFAATGSAAGLLLSPLPWKLLDDLAINTQRSRFAPDPLRGEVSFRFTACTLCPAGCAVRARCVGGRPVSLSGVRDNPVSRGALCATGFAAHHLLGHPARLARPARVVFNGDKALTGPAQLDEVIADAVGAMKSTRAAVPLAVLDLRPGRAASRQTRRLLAGLPGAVLVTPPAGAGATLAAVRERLEGKPGPLGADLAAARAVIGFGAPLLEGWGAPGTVAALIARDARARLVQAEPSRSPTAEGADRWLPILPGSEAAVALGIAHVLLREGLVAREVLDRAGDRDAFVALANRFDPVTVERQAGIGEARLVEAARVLAQGPSLALGGGAPGAGPLSREAEAAIAALNLLLDGVGREGGLVVRRELPEPAADGPLAPETPLDTLADGSVGVLVLDSAPGDALAWDAIAGKLAPDARVVSLSPWLFGLSEHSHWAVPGPAPFEALEEALPYAGAPVATWGISSPLQPPPQGVTEPPAFLARLLAGAGATPAACEPAEALLKRRAAAIAATTRGRVFAPGAAPEAVGDADALFAKVSAGAVWVDDPPTPLRSRPRFTFFAAPDEAARLAACAARPCPAAPPAARPPRGYVGATGAVPAPALLVKLGRESHLRVPMQREA